MLKNKLKINVFMQLQSSTVSQYLSFHLHSTYSLIMNSIVYNDSSFFQIDIDNIETPDYKIDLDYYNNFDTIQNTKHEIIYTKSNTPTSSMELCCISKKYFENANDDEELGIT